MAEHTPAIFIAPFHRGGFVVTLTPPQWSGFTDAIFVAYPSLLSTPIRVSPSGLVPVALEGELTGEDEHIIAAALAAWGNN